jgi:steroid 5-alpha reductase family enzyme
MFAGLAAVLALFTTLWLVSLAVRNSSIVDMWWGPAIFLIGLTYYFTTTGVEDRRLLILSCVGLWAVRLAAYIGARNIGHGEDFRYAKWRAERGASWWWFSCIKVFLLQGVIAWIVALPLYFAMSAGTPGHFTAFDQLGTLIFAIGFAFEAIGDEQLRQFRANPGNKGRVLSSGLWRYTRHPNYFGEAVLWWGLAIIALGTPNGAYGLIGAALITFLLIRVSGVALLEKTLTQTKPDYADYIARTSAFVPMPPR